MAMASLHADQTSVARQQGSHVFLPRKLVGQHVAHVKRIYTVQ